ncbi:cytochrome c oxidase accessory protein CcoG [Flavobacterium sp. NST-5]|uniref:Cytochrome c oxidase accessory protein CcoG n=1 Tax=Flavobacterium ichthyis TaxID=2698827 RepID=A0ABW9ZB61_9FLAO|nr:cytochrome c oxidase accessory protein CcoG [Flavobacterium ichthyis]NBL64033.1 cytochrome c oxidase accessory protein CcoG [Flavobacterium ichthyis]
MTKYNESFRDNISTVDETGKRVWVFPKIPSGKFYQKRKIASYVLLTFLIAAPFIKINENQFLLFNIIDRKFSIFGFPFWPQDFYLFVISMLIGVIFVALFTVAFGRIFCGWICPQTIFMEMVFRRIEFWIEGDRGAQIRLNKQKWDAEKIRKKSLKWLLFFVISFMIANVFLAYIIGSDELLELMIQGPANNGSTLIALLIFTAVFYFVYAWFREQVCIIACPYGRLQGVLLDNKSMIVAYDHVRGEKEKGRAKFNKSEDRNLTGKGDCIDCKLCVAVCPTGIDIRNGTQLECINCTACIDECDAIMEKVNLPKGLIRYASEDEIIKKEKFIITARMKGYAAVLAILCGILVGLLFLRSNLDVSILRLPGQLFQHKGNKISNVYTFKLVNKTHEDKKNISFKLIEPVGEIKLVGKPTISVQKEGMSQGTLFVEIVPELLEADKTKITIGVFENEKLIETQNTNFLGPRVFK